MNAVKIVNHEQPISGRNKDKIVQQIHVLLNQGNLFEIYQILDRLKNGDDKKYVINAYISKYGFNFINYI